MGAILRKVILICVIGVLNGCASGSEAGRSSALPCNVFTGSACFTISSGDIVTTQVVVDYMLYHVSIANISTVTIYSGFNPSPRDAPANPWGGCRSVIGFGECRERQHRDGIVEVIARPSKQAEYVHILADGGDRTQRFLRTVHPCSSDAFSTRCDAGLGR